MHQYRKHFEAGKTDLIYMPDVHTTMSEDLSFRHVLQLASHIDNAAVYMHHVTAKMGVDAVRQYRATGQPIYAETLAENRAMIDVFLNSGFPVTSTSSYGTVSVRFPIDRPR